MRNTTNNNYDFLNFLINLSKNQTNPFIFSYLYDANKNPFPYNHRGFYEDLLEKEVRCPIYFLKSKKQ